MGSANKFNNVLPLLASAARAVTSTGVDITNEGHKGLHFYINVATTGSNITPKIQGKDPVSAKYYDLLVGVAITSTGLTVLKVYPGILTAANASASDFLPSIWRFRVTANTTKSVTYSVAANLEA